MKRRMSLPRPQALRCSSRVIWSTRLHFVTCTWHAKRNENIWPCRQWKTSCVAGWQYRDADKSLARLDWKKKTIERSPFFCPTRSLLPRRSGWTDNLLIFFFFWVAWKVQSLVAVACFLPGRAKDLSAPRYSHWSNAPLLYIIEWNFSNFINQAP